MNVYRGKSDGLVMVNGKQLKPRLDIFNHSPTGFAWGFAGSGPSQLALAIMVYEFGDNLIEHPADYQRFKNEVVAQLGKGKEFVLTSDDIADWLSG